MNLGKLGSLMVEITAKGANEARGQLEGMQDATQKAGNEAKRQVPVLERMGKRWSSVLTLVSVSGAATFGLIAKSSPAVLGSLKGMQLAFESIFMMIGDELAPVFETLVNALWKVSEWFDELSPTTKTLIAGLALGVIVVGALAGAFLAGAAAVAAVGASALATGLIIGGVLIAAIAALYVAWKNNVFGIRDTAYSVFNWLKERWTSLMDILYDENMTTWEKIRAVFWWAVDTMKDILSTWWTTYKNVMKWLYDETVEKFTDIKNTIINAIKGAYDYVIDKLGSMGDVISGVVNKVKDFFTGGSSSSSSGGRDMTQYDSDGRVSLRQKVPATRALGGPVLSGMSYLVGEEGPELFTPRLSGSITSNKKTQQTLTQKQDRPIEINLKIETQLDGRKVWESVRKFSASELRRLGA